MREIAVRIVNAKKNPRTANGERARPAAPFLPSAGGSTVVLAVDLADVAAELLSVVLAADDEGLVVVFVVEPVTGFVVELLPVIGFVVAAEEVGLAAVDTVVVGFAVDENT
jgi:hypothetical protein